MTNSDGFAAKPLAANSKLPDTWTNSQQTADTSGHFDTVVAAAFAERFRVQTLNSSRKSPRTTEMHGLARRLQWF